MIMAKQLDVTEKKNIKWEWSKISKIIVTMTPTRTAHGFYNSNFVSNVWKGEIMYTYYVSSACIYS